jgi:hypothetical protein
MVNPAKAVRAMDHVRNGLDEWEELSIVSERLKCPFECPLVTTLCIPKS